MRYSRAEAGAVNEVHLRQNRVHAAEATRATIWGLLPPKDRQRAASLGGLDNARGLAALETFTDAERARIVFALEVHIHHMQMVVKCMASSQADKDGYILAPRRFN